MKRKESEKIVSRSARFLPQAELVPYIRYLMQTQPVMGPKERWDQRGFYLFDWLESPEEFVPDYITTTIPPKKVFSPPEEPLVWFTLDGFPGLEHILDKNKFILAGVHPCDLAAIDALDMAYGLPPADTQWEANRRRASIIGIDCMPDEYCFCTSVDTCDARHPCDLFLTALDSGYLVEVFSQSGEALLAGARTREAQEKELKSAELRRQKKRQAVSAKFNTPFTRLAEILDKGGLTHVWKETAERCYSCGSCNTTCPTCFCFNMEDTFDLSLQSGFRRRTWDSCQLLEFALIAGGENMRAERWQRVRHRWHRKFLYLFLQFGRPYCTGCGRCSRACTADINMVDVTNRIVKVAEQEVSNESQTR